MYQLTTYTMQYKYYWLHNYFDKSFNKSLNSYERSKICNYCLYLNTDFCHLPFPVIRPQCSILWVALLDKSSWFNHLELKDVWKNISLMSQSAGKTLWTNKILLRSCLKLRSESTLNSSSGHYGDRINGVTSVRS